MIREIFGLFQMDETHEGEKKGNHNPKEQD
jgi:hypothetical protein